MCELFKEYPKAVSAELMEIRRRELLNKKRQKTKYNRKGLCRRVKLMSYLLTKKALN